MTRATTSTICSETFEIWQAIFLRQGNSRMSTARQKMILDTNVLSNLRREHPHPALVAWLATVDPALVFTTVASVVEIESGIARAPRPDKAAQLANWLENLLELANVMVLDVPAARTLGRMQAHPAMTGFLVGPTGRRPIKLGIDLTIASIAITQHATVVTGDYDDFVRIALHFPLIVFDPFGSRTHSP
ncbi:MAG: PIN domain-containing protein [Acetobacteraceae bacterium]